MTGQQSFEERFGFMARGQFRCIGWFEKPLTVLGLLLLLVGGVLITVLFANPYFAFGGSFGALPFVLAAWFILCWWIVRIAHTGVTCRYEANDSEFRITDNRQHTEIFYYPDIMGVDYKPIPHQTPARLYRDDTHPLPVGRVPLYRKRKPADKLTGGYAVLPAGATLRTCQEYSPGGGRVADYRLKTRTFYKKQEQPPWTALIFIHRNVPCTE